MKNWIGVSLPGLLLLCGCEVGIGRPPGPPVLERLESYPLNQKVTTTTNEVQALKLRSDSSSDSFDVLIGPALPSYQPAETNAITRTAQFGFNAAGPGVFIQSGWCFARGVRLHIRTVRVFAGTTGSRMIAHLLDPPSATQAEIIYLLEGSGGYVEKIDHTQRIVFTGKEQYVVVSPAGDLSGPYAIPVASADPIRQFLDYALERAKLAGWPNY